MSRHGILTMEVRPMVPISTHHFRMLLSNMEFPTLPKANFLPFSQTPISGIFLLTDLQWTMTHLIPPGLKVSHSIRETGRPLRLNASASHFWLLHVGQNFLDFLWRHIGKWQRMHMESMFLIVSPVARPGYSDWRFWSSKASSVQQLSPLEDAALKISDPCTVRCTKIGATWELSFCRKQKSQKIQPLWIWGLS